MTGMVTIRASLEQCYDAIESLAGHMDATRWHARSLCSDWDMRGVITRSPFVLTIPAHPGANPPETHRTG